MIFTDEEQMKTIKIILAIINVYCQRGLKLKHLEREFLMYCGYPLPYKKFGVESLRSWILTLPDIYLVEDEDGEEILFQHSEKSNHIKQLINKQKSSVYKQDHVIKKNHSKKSPPVNQSHIHQSINVVAFNESIRFEEFSKLECMLPLFYKHQALGDDFLLDIADTKFGYYVPEGGPNECGLCASKQTIRELTKKVETIDHLAPRVVVMIGLTDLLMGQNVNDMIADLRSLVSELKKRNTRTTLITLVPTPKMLNTSKIFFNRMEIFNNAILDYSFCDQLKCNVIDMYTIFTQEQNRFQRNCDRLTKITKKDKYKVFSDFGRKIFISNLKNCLIQQLIAGH
ncbi:uncharacterized protein LOC130451726 [Diorhabda sublineata]|uniref:uncharacterized protein LOC130451726 n=1 Tax=Diorhabda sublineata TaxID=1163346 RepID=UPI0024E12B20|nr:uncharacterized protein LOC130451726 [Diorhabda sublineata]